MSAGPKAAPLHLPLDLEGLPRSGGARVVAFLERYVRTTKGKGAKKPLKVRDWQSGMLRGVFDSPRPRAALWSMPRGQGKSTLAAGIGLYGLFADGVEGASVVVVAADERQARIVWGTAVRMCELEPELEQRVQTFHDRLYIPRTGSEFRVLPAEPKGLEGLDPSLAIVDVIGVVDRRTYEAITGAVGKRASSLLLMIGTPSPDGTESVMWEQVEHGHDHPEDESFRLVEFTAPADAEITDETAWETANPALDDFLYRDGVRATLPPKLRESTFRRYRLGQWVDQVDEPWMDRELWASCTSSTTSIPDGADVVLALDGSFSGDCTALVVSAVGDIPHLDLAGLWQNPGDPDWRVPVIEVEDAIRAACSRWSVLEVTADPFRWQRTLQVLDGERIPISEFPQSPSRMTPATTALYEAVVNKQVTHSGDDRLAKHVSNCVLKADSRGTRLVKEHKHSRRHIDLAVAACMAHNRARYHASQPRAQIFVLDG